MNWITPEKTCQEGGRHNFESLLMETNPPTPEQMEAADVQNYRTAQDVATIVESLTQKKYVVCCTWCRMKAE